MIAVLLPLILAGALQPTAVPTPRTPDRKEPALLGLAVNLPDAASSDDRQKALDLVRAAGVSMFAFEVSWPQAERRPGRYDVVAVTRAARLLRQSGAVLHLDLPLVNGRDRVTPPGLARFAFDDPRLSLALGRLLDALGPALLDFSTLSLANEADSYFADRPAELAAFLRLFDGAVTYLGHKAPRLLVGITTAAPTDSRAPVVAATLHQKSPALFYLYAPFSPDAPFTHRPPETLERDWKAILAAARGRPVGFTEVSYSSSAENGSSPAKQAEFVRRMLRFLSASDRARLLFARYAPWRDPAPPTSPGPANPPEGAGGGGASLRREAFLANRGLQMFDGTPKPAWRELGTPPPPSKRGHP
ncbi:MAG TPA: hypothetical protein VKS03_07865 [Thermoanaerobaculia bacterium]|nr:hypothetical protein [Thermoanaerobaculia bacterium]